MTINRNELKALADRVMTDSRFCGDEHHKALAVGVQDMQAQIDRLEAQVKTLQSDANSWQSGYDEGRRIGTKTALDERSQLKALIGDLTPDFDEVARICRALAWLGVAVPAGGEEQAARWRDLVRQVVLAAEQSKMLRQDAGDIQSLRRRAEFWRSPADMPEQGRPVIVLRDAISVGNSLHPGARCGRWLELTSSIGTMFACDAMSTGSVIGWADADEFLGLGKLRANAERYGWLRDKQTFIWLIQDWFPGAEFTDVDAEIDAAMAKEASHE